MQLVIAEHVSQQLITHLFQDRSEWVAFLFATADGSDLRATEAYLVQPEDYAVQGPFHVELGDEIRPDVIKAASDRGACLVEAHSHRLNREAAFSPTDLDGLDEFVPHVLWRLPGRPYVALVFAQESFDGIIWPSKAAKPATLAGIRVGDAPLRLPTCKSLARLLARDKT